MAACNIENMRVAWGQSYQRIAVVSLPCQLLYTLFASSKWSTSGFIVVPWRFVLSKYCWKHFILQLWHHFLITAAHHTLTVLNQWQRQQWLLSSKLVCRSSHNSYSSLQIIYSCQLCFLHLFLCWICWSSIVYMVLQHITKKSAIATAYNLARFRHSFGYLLYSTILYIYIYCWILILACVVCSVVQLGHWGQGQIQKRTEVGGGLYT